MHYQAAEQRPTKAPETGRSARRRHPSIYIGNGVSAILLALVAITLAGCGSSNTTASAVISGRIVYAGGPRTGNYVAGSVLLRTPTGQLVATTTASRRSGFRFQVPPGHYTLTANTPRLVRQTGCPATPVAAAPNLTTHANVYTACFVK